MNENANNKGRRLTEDDLPTVPIDAAESTTPASAEGGAPAHRTAESAPENFAEATPQLQASQQVQTTIPQSEAITPQPPMEVQPDASIGAQPQPEPQQQPQPALHIDTSKHANTYNPGSVKDDHVNAYAKYQVPNQMNNVGTIPPSSTTVPPTPPTPGAPVPPVSGTPEPPKKKNRTMVPISSAVIMALVVGAAAWGGTTLAMTNLPQHTQTNATQTELVIDDVENADEDATLATLVAKKATPSVVSIYTYTDHMDYSDMYSLFMSGVKPDSVQDDEPVLSGLGSGIIISSDGYILTNNHVIEGADSFKVSVGDDSYDAKVVGTDPSSDIAVIKVEATGLPVIEAADSSKLQVGDWTMAIGAPYGYEETCTTGIVSALSRSTAMQGTNGTTIYANLIQTDAAINSGNSGGALVDDQGRLIGMNTLISSSSGSSAGIGFAIPSNYAMNVARQIMDSGEVRHAQLGVTVTENPDGSGAVVETVNEGSAAADAGLQPKDIIIAVDGSSIIDASDVIYSIRGHLVGDEVTIKYLRNGEERSSTITLGDDAAVTVEADDPNDRESGNEQPDMQNGDSSNDARQQLLDELLKRFGR